MHDKLQPVADLDGRRKSNAQTSDSVLQVRITGEFQVLRGIISALLNEPEIEVSGINRAREVIVHRVGLKCDPTSRVRMSFALERGTRVATLKFEIGRILLPVIRFFLRASLRCLERVRGTVSKLEKVGQRGRMLEQRFEDLFKRLGILDTRFDLFPAPSLPQRTEAGLIPQQILQIPAQPLCEVRRRVAGRDCS